MSHCLGAICTDHGEVLMRDTCPERDCPGHHGYSPVECGPTCPRYVQPQEENRGQAKD